MVPATSNGASPTPPYSGYHLSPLTSFTGLSPSLAWFPTQFKSSLVLIMWSYNPQLAVTSWVWAVARSLATTGAITFVFSSSGYLDVSVPRVCSRLAADTVPSARWVAPFGHLRINPCLRVPAAFRSLPRPSSPLRA